MKSVPIVYLQLQKTPQVMNPHFFLCQRPKTYAGQQRLELLLLLTYNFQVDFEVLRRRLSKIDPATILSPVFVTKILDPKHRKRNRTFFESGPGSQFHAVVPMTTDLDPVAANVVTAILKQKKNHITDGYVQKNAAGWHTVAITRHSLIWQLFNKQSGAKRTLPFLQSKVSVKAIVFFTV